MRTVGANGIAQTDNLSRLGTLRRHRAEVLVGQLKGILRLRLVIRTVKKDLDQRGLGSARADIDAASLQTDRTSSK